MFKETCSSTWFSKSIRCVWWCFVINSAPLMIVCNQICSCDDFLKSIMCRRGPKKQTSCSVTPPVNKLQCGWRAHRHHYVLVHRTSWHCQARHLCLRYVGLEVHHPKTRLIYCSFSFRRSRILTTIIGVPSRWIQVMWRNKQTSKLLRHQRKVHPTLPSSMERCRGFRKGYDGPKTEHSLQG